MSANTVFLRLEGPMQAWGSHEAKFVIRRTMDAPTKSGVIGLLLAAKGISRPEARTDWLSRLSDLKMGVRIDRPGIRWWDYHTVGAEMLMRTADGGHKKGAMLTRREYLCDASFLVALQGEIGLIAELECALQKPKWTLYLGRKSCPPSRPLCEHQEDKSRYPSDHPDILSALQSVPWRPRYKGDQQPPIVEVLCDWYPSETEPNAPDDAETWYDVPYSLDPPAHLPRLVTRKSFIVSPNGDVKNGTSTQNFTPPPPRPRADYGNTHYKEVRLNRLQKDNHLCVFCKLPLFGKGATVQHITYRHAGGDERIEELRSLCRLCHDAVTMIEYGAGMEMERINPEEERWRERIRQKRDEIVASRSIETRRRRLEAEEV